MFNLLRRIFRRKPAEAGFPVQTSAADAWLPCNFETNRVAFLAERELMRPMYTIDPKAFVQITSV